MNKKEQEIYNLCAPSVQSLGFELWGIEYLPQGKYSTLRIYIDKADGVILDELSEVSQQLNGVLDVEDPIHGEYRLEVSSPGIERRLFFPAQYARYQGSPVQVKCHEPVNERRNFKGILEQVGETDITLICDEQAFVLEFENIDKANVLSEMSHGK